MQTCIQGRCIVIRKRSVNGIANMSSVNELLDQVRDGGNFPSDNALAQRMGLTRAVISTWRSGRNPIPDERIAQLCALAKLDGPAWTARVHAERAASPAERAMWKSMLDRLSAAAAVLALVAVAMPGVARAKAIDLQGFSAGSQPHSVYYVLTNLAGLTWHLPQPSQEPQPPQTSPTWPQLSMQSMQSTQSTRATHCKAA